MSAPAGWHLQPDGRERFWDGTQWTDQFRAVEPPQQSDPTAPPPAPSWAQPGSGDEPSSSGGDPTAPSSEPTTAQQPAWDQTQALDVSSTQAIPAPQGYAETGQPSYTQSDPYASQPSAFGAPSTGYGAPTSGYGAPGAPGQPGPGWQPPQQGGNAWLKGCLIALAVVVVLAIGAIVAAVFLFNRAVDTVSDSVSSSFPSGLPTELPSGLPTDLPSGLPTEGLGEQVGVTVGKGFAIPRATIEDGWSLNKQGAGALSVVTVDGMRATLQDEDGIPVLFTIGFRPAGGGEDVQTVCTAPAGAAGATVDVSCVPLLGDVADARQGTVTTTL